MILGARGPHFGFYFGSTLKALGLWENSWKFCKGCQFQRFGPCQTESFYRSWLWVRFGDIFFHFFVIFSCLGAFILRVFWRNRCQKGGLQKKTQKRSKQRSTGQAAKTVSGGVGPFKTTKRNIRKVSKLDRWTKHAQTSLKARWRIKLEKAHWALSR